MTNGIIIDLAKAMKNGAIVRVHPNLKIKFMTIAM